MKLMVDANVIYDVLSRREPWHQAADKICQLIADRQHIGILSSHCLTTIGYMVRKYAGGTAMRQAIDWMLKTFDIPALSKAELIHARALPIDDYEDAVVAAVAELNQCDFILTRDLSDFKDSPVKFISPSEFLATYSPC